MAIDLAALKTALETDSRYDAAVKAGKNRDLLTLLNASEPARTKIVTTTRDDVMEAIGDGIRTLTSMEVETLSLLLGVDTVDFTKAGILSEIENIFSANATVLSRLRALHTVSRTYGEAFAGEPGDVVTNRDLGAVLSQIPKSYMATKTVADGVKAAANEATIATLQAAIQIANPGLKVSSARSQAIRDMYIAGTEA